MPTVIDSLVVELGLDPSKFTKGQREALNQFKQTQEAAVRGGKEIEEQGRRTTQTFSSLRNQAVGLFAAFTGGKGLQEFVSYLNRSDATLGRFSRNVGISAGEVSKWQGAARLVGGTAEGLAGSFQTLSDTFAGWKIGIVSPMVADLRAISTAGGKVIDINSGVEKSTLDLADNLKKIHDVDPARAGLLGRRLGLDPAFFDLLIRGSGATKEILDYVRQIGTATKADTVAAGELETRWENLKLRSEKIGRTVLTWATPYIGAVADWLNKSPRDALRQLLLQIPGTTDAEPENAPTPLGPHPASPGAQSLLRLKPGAAGGGGTSLGVLALAASLQRDIPELQRFTALNDAFHAGTSSKHAGGLALDFTLSDPGQSAAIAAKVREKLSAMGVDGTVLDEYANPSSRATGGHIHVGFANAAAAQRYSDLSGGGRSSSTSTNTTNIGTIVVNTQATDAGGIAKDIDAAVKRNSFAAQANSGQN